MVRHQEVRIVGAQGVHKEPHQVGQAFRHSGGEGSQVRSGEQRQVRVGVLQTQGAGHLQPEPAGCDQRFGQTPHDSLDG